MTTYKVEENKEKGYVWLPYITKTVKTEINGETVWYANKWKNLLLKIKHFFIKPKYLKNAHLYSKKTINDKFYQRIKIDKNDEYIGKETTVNFSGDLRMSQPWRSYPNDEVFVIVKQCRNGLYLLRDTKGQEHPLKKSNINYFNKNGKEL